MSRAPFVGAALAGIEIPIAHAIASMATLSTATERRISNCLCVSDCLGVIDSLPPRTLHFMLGRLGRYQAESALVSRPFFLVGRPAWPEPLEQLVDLGSRLACTRRKPCDDRQEAVPSEGVHLEI